MCDEEMRIEDFEFTGAVAFLDILGFGTAMAAAEPGRLKEIRDNYIGKLIHAVMTSQMTVQHDLDNYVRLAGIRKAPVLKWVSFADSVVLYLPVEKDRVFSRAEEVIESMIYTCSWLSCKFRGAMLNFQSIECIARERDLSNPISSPAKEREE